jgi:hypothetical protein
MKMLKLPLFLLLTVAMLAGCKDDDDDDTPTKRQILRVFVDGELQQGVGVLSVEDTKGQYGETVRDFNLSAALKDYNFRIAITNWSWQGMPPKGPKVKTYFPSTDEKKECRMGDDFNLMCEKADVYYFRSRDKFYTTPLYDYKENVVGITRNSGNTIDGYFDVVCVTTADDTVHLEGSFNDVVLE